MPRTEWPGRTTEDLVDPAICNAVAVTRFVRDESPAKIEPASPEWHRGL